MNLQQINRTLKLFVSLVRNQSLKKRYPCLVVLVLISLTLVNFFYHKDAFRIVTNKVDYEIIFEQEDASIPFSKNLHSKNLDQRKTFSAPKVEEEFDVESLPEHSNPWNDQIEETVSVVDEFETVMVDGCPVRSYVNVSSYKNTKFVESDYRPYFEKCRKKESKEEERDFQLKDKISIHKTEFRYKISTDFKYHQRPPVLSLCERDFETDRNNFTPSTLVVVNTKAEGFQERETIRQTWGKDITNSDWSQLIFFIPNSEDESTREKIKIESMSHKDILQNEFLDGDADQYRHNEMISLISWVEKSCPLLHFLVKVDSPNTFVNSNRLKSLQAMERHSSNRIYGTILKDMEPDRNPEGRNFVSEMNWPWAKFPPFFEEGILIFSADVIRDLLIGAKFLPRMKLPQVYLTGILPSARSVRKIEISDFIGDFPSLPAKKKTGEEKDEDFLRISSDFKKLSKFGFITNIPTGEKAMTDLWRKFAWCGGKKDEGS